MKKERKKALEIETKINFFLLGGFGLFDGTLLLAMFPRCSVFYFPKRRRCFRHGTLLIETAETRRDAKERNEMNGEKENEMSVNKIILKKKDGERERRD